MSFLLRQGAFLGSLLSAFANAAGPLSASVVALDRATPGQLGVYMKKLSDHDRFEYAADRSWYLASTTKIPVAIVLLRLVDRGEVSLCEELTLGEDDFVDGSGELQNAPPGTRFSLGVLLEKMIVDSDSTAADLLIERIEVQRLNRHIREEIRIPGFGPITTLLQVRKDAYSELHPRAGALTNRDFLDLKRHRDLEERLQAFMNKLGIARQELKAPSIEGAFERYYRSGKNSGTLEAVGILLERLVRGDLLAPGSTSRLLGLMERMETGENRLKAGLAPGALFAQKTGTQVNRLCNIGVIWGGATRVPREATVIAVCVQGFHSEGTDLKASQEEAERTLERVARVLMRS